MALVACSKDSGAPAGSIYFGTASDYDGVVEADIDLVAEPSEKLVEDSAFEKRGDIGYQLTGGADQQVKTEFDAKNPRILASVTKISTALAALRNVSDVNVAEVSAMLRESHNYQASMLLRRFAQTVLGMELPPPKQPSRGRSAAHTCPSNGTVEAPAAREVLSWLKKMISADWTNAELADGSGCSYENKMSPEQLVEILQYADSLGPAFSDQDFASLLASPGRSGTLRSRLGGLSGRAKVFAKTGTLNGAITLAGYLFVPKGKEIEKYYFAVLISTNSRAEARSARARIDYLVKSWARKLAS